MTKLNLEIDLPHDPEAEMIALGMALAGRGGYGLIAALEVGDFHNALNGAAWTIIEEIGKTGREPDVLNVVGELEARGHGRAATSPLIYAFSNSVETGIDPVNLMSRLKGLTIKRRALWTLHGMAADLQSTSYSIVAEDQVGMAVATLTGLTNDHRQFVTLEEVGADYLTQEEPSVSSTGFANLDQALAGGFHQNRLYGFSGKMKAGKTGFMVSMSYNMVELGIPHVYLCLEMRPNEIGRRYYARRMGVNALSFYDHRVRNSPAFVRKLIEAQRYFAESGCLAFKAKPRMDLETLRATVATIALSGKYRGVFIDYAQLVGGQARNQNETNHLDNVCQTVAELAATYPLWFAMGAQQNDEGGVRGGKGFAAACDVLFGLDNSDPDDSPYEDSSGRRERRHLSMQFSRYTMATDIGSPDNPGYILRNDVGPYFEEL